MQPRFLLSPLHFSTKEYKNKQQFPYKKTQTKNQKTETPNFRATIDIDRDGDISKEEFITHAMKSQFIADILKEKDKSQRKSNY